MYPSQRSVSRCVPRPRMGRDRSSPRMARTEVASADHSVLDIPLQRNVPRCAGPGPRPCALYHARRSRGVLTVPPESPSTVPLVHRWIANRAVRSAPALVVAAALFVWANAAIAYPGLDFPKIRSGMESDVRHVMSAVGPGLIWEPLTASYSYPPLAQCDDGPYYQAALEMQATFPAAGSSSFADRFR